MKGMGLGLGLGILKLRIEFLQNSFVPSILLVISLVIFSLGGVVVGLMRGSCERGVLTCNSVFVWIADSIMYFYGADSRDVFPYSAIVLINFAVVLLDFINGKSELLSHFSCSYGRVLSTKP